MRSARRLVGTASIGSPPARLSAKMPTSFRRSCRSHSRRASSSRSTRVRSRLVPPALIVLSTRAAPRQPGRPRLRPARAALLRRRPVSRDRRRRDVRVRGRRRLPARRDPRDHATHASVGPVAFQLVDVSHARSACRPAQPTRGRWRGARGSLRRHRTRHRLQPDAHARRGRGAGPVGRLHVLDPAPLAAGSVQRQHDRGARIGAAARSERPQRRPRPALPAQRVRSERRGVRDAVDRQATSRRAVRHPTATAGAAQRLERADGAQSLERESQAIGGAWACVLDFTHTVRSILQTRQTRQHRRPRPREKVRLRCPSPSLIVSRRQASSASTKRPALSLRGPRDRPRRARRAQAGLRAHIADRGRVFRGDAPELVFPQHVRVRSSWR